MALCEIKSFYEFINFKTERRAKMIANAEVNKMYMESQLTPSSKEEIALMLYDGAIRFLRSARNEMVRKNNLLEKAKLIEKTVNIIDYMKSALDMDKGKEIAANLNRLYEYMMVQLTEANVKNDPRNIDEAIDLLLVIRDGWSQICGNNKSKQQAAVSPQQSFVKPAHAPLNSHPINQAAYQPQARFAVKV